MTTADPDQPRQAELPAPRATRRVRRRALVHHHPRELDAPDRRDSTARHAGTALSWVDTHGNRWCACGHPTHADQCGTRHCPCAAINHLMSTGDLANTAREIADRLRDNGFPAEGDAHRQVLCLAEEVGEFVGAYRRWSGQARRQGSAADMHAELADVVITAYVTACELGVNLDDAITAKLDVIFTRGWREQPAFVCPTPDTCPCRGDADEHDVFARHAAHAVTGRDDCPYCVPAAEYAQWEADQAAALNMSTIDSEPDTVPCGFDCGYLAENESDLDTHEAQCDRGLLGGEQP